MRSSNSSEHNGMKLEITYGQGGGGELEKTHIRRDKTKQPIN